MAGRHEDMQVFHHRLRGEKRMVKSRDSFHGSWDVRQEQCELPHALAQSTNRSGGFSTSPSEVGMLIDYTLSGSRIFGVRQSQLRRLLAARL